MRGRSQILKKLCRSDVENSWFALKEVRFDLEDVHFDFRSITFVEKSAQLDLKNVLFSLKSVQYDVKRVLKVQQKKKPSKFLRKSRSWRSAHGFARL